MKIKTKFFEEIEIEERDVITFENGIPAFEEFHNFIIMDIKDNNKIKCLQSIDESQVCFLTVSPWDYFSDYEIDLSDNEINYLDISNESDVAVFNIITLKDNLITLNLAGPIIINTKNRKAKQIVLPNNKYNVRHEIKCLF